MKTQKSPPAASVALMKWDTDAQTALKRWEGTAWIGMSQDTSSVTYDEPFNGWVFSDDTPVISVPWADGEPNNGVQTSVTSTTDRPEENHAYVRSSFKELARCTTATKASPSRP